MAFKLHKKVQFPPEFLVAEKLFTQYFQQALQFLSQTPVVIEEKTAKLVQLPWFLFIGPSSTGKTSLLHHGDLELIHSQKYPSPNVQPLRAEFFITPQCVYVDTPGIYWHGEDENFTQRRQNELLKQLNRYHRKKALSGIVLVFSVHDFLQWDDLQNARLQQQLQFLARLTSKLNKQGRIPIQILLTHMDQITGWNEYFADCTPDETESIFGLQFPEEANSSHANCCDHFHQQFDHFIHSVHGLLAQRIQSASSRATYSRLMQFPLELEQTEAGLKAFIDAFYKEDRISQRSYMSGIYFVSNQQSGLIHDSFENIFESTVGHYPLPQLPSSKESRPLFIRQIIQSLPHIPIMAQNTYQRYPWINQATIYGGYASLGAISILFLALWLSAMRQDIQLVNDAQSALIQYQVLLPALSDANLAPLEQIIIPLNHLDEARRKLATVENHFWANWLSDRTQLAYDANKAYQHALQTLLLPQLRELMAQRLASNQIAYPSELYATLQTYLMLGNSKIQNPASIERWVQLAWARSKPLSPELIHALLPHIREALATNATVGNVNSELVSQIRSKLYAIPAPQLAYAILLSTADLANGKPLALIAQPEHLRLFASPPLVPYLYTKAGYDAIIQPALSQAAQAAVNGNWVLGRPPHNPQEDSLSVDEIAQQTRAIYLSDYAEVWQKTIQNLQLKQFTQLNQVVETIHALRQKPSLLTSLIQSIRDNTSFLNDEVVTNPYLAARISLASQQLSNLTTLPVDPNTGNVSQLRDVSPEIWKNLDPSLKELQSTLEIVTHAKNPGLAALQLSAYRLNHAEEFDTFNQMQRISEELPMPLSQWLKQLTTQSWRLLLTNAQSYLNGIWQNQVFAFYQGRLSGRYPLIREASADASISDFVAFFAPNGIFDQFFRNYLAAFVNTDQEEWKLKERDGQSLTFLPDTLKQMQQLYDVQAGFFQGHREGIYLPMRITPVAFSPDVSEFSIQVNQQNYLGLNAKSQEINLSLDPNHPISLIRMNIATTTDEPVSATFTGPWAVLKMLDNNAIAPEAEPNHYELLLSVNRHGGKYQLIADSAIDPILADSQSDINLPHTL